MKVEADGDVLAADAGGVGADARKQGEEACAPLASHRETPRERALRTRPWVYSTGPRTPEGKHRSAMRGMTHGRYSSLAKAAAEAQSVLIEAIRRGRRA